MKHVFAWLFSRTIFRAFLVYSDHDGSMLADSVTYRALFSVFASILLGFSVAGLWFGGNPEALHALGDALDKTIPGIGEVLDTDSATAPAPLTFAGIVSLGGLIFAAAGAARSLRSALHQISGDEFVTKPVVTVYLRDLGVAAGLGLLIGLAAAATFVSSLGLGTITHALGISEGSQLADILGRTVGVLVIYAVDVLAIALIFTLLGGVKPTHQALWRGSALGGMGLLVLQEFSSLFVAGATSNPLLASFAALIVLLLWFNLSAQVILIASSWITVRTWEETGDIRAFKDASNMGDWRIRQAEAAVKVAKEDLQRTKDDVAASHKKQTKAVKAD